MNQMLFEFIWDQSKKNQDKNLIKFLVGLDSDIKDTKKCATEDTNCVFQEIEASKKELVKEINKGYNDLQLQIDEIRRRMDDRLHFLERNLREEFGKTETPVNTEK